MEQDGTGIERQTVVKTPDGDPLLLRRVAFSPLRYDDQLSYLRGPEVEAVMWVLTAAGSGIIGNLATDAVKRLIKKTRTLHSKFLARLSKQHESIQPGDELRGYLIEIASDALARRRNLQQKDSGGLIREANVFFTKNGTWAVVGRESGKSKPVMVEIDLRNDAEGNHYEAVGDVKNFPVGIWWDD